jgi:hypothetical protein
MRFPCVVPFALAAVLLTAAAPAAHAATPAKTAAVKVPKHGAVPAAVPFIDDDLTKAMALAKQTKRPVFIEAWAPW